MWRRGAEQKRQLGRPVGADGVDLISEFDWHRPFSVHQRRAGHDSPAASRRAIATVPITSELVFMRDPRRGPRSLSKWTPMADHQLQLDPRSEEAGRTRLVGPARSCEPPFLPHPRSHPQVRPRLAAADQAVQEEILEGPAAAGDHRRDAIHRRTLALADLGSAGIAVLIGVPILGDDALNPIALLALPLVLVVGKLTGLYDRDEHLIRKTTLDEVPALFWVATLYALLIWLGGNLIVDGSSAASRRSGFGLSCSHAWSRRAPSPGARPGLCRARSVASSWATLTPRIGSRAGSTRCRA